MAIHVGGSEKKFNAERRASKGHNESEKKGETKWENALD